MSNDIGNSMNGGRVLQIDDNSEAMVKLKLQNAVECVLSYFSHA